MSPYLLFLINTGTEIVISLAKQYTRIQRDFQTGFSRKQNFGRKNILHFRFIIFIKGIILRPIVL